MSRIFLSYRRDDTQGHALALFDHLGARFGEAEVFMDIDTIEPGIDFIERIEEAVSQCSALVALIGPSWLSSPDSAGKRRLENPDDYVRIEIAAALERNVRVIPVLVQGATMPGADELPENLRRLARRQALELSPTRFRYDVSRLLEALESVRRVDASERAHSNASAATDVDDATPRDLVAPRAAGRLLGAGDLFAGYRIETEVGRGAMGIVYVAEQLRPSRIVALKVMSPPAHTGDDARFRARFEQESHLAARIEHPHVIPIHEVGEEEGIPFIAMRYVAEGTDLRRLIRGEGRLHPRRAVRILAQVASALDAAHSRGLVHCDVKPENVLIDQSAGLEHVYLTDFGVASSIGAEVAEGIGTLDYSAPEQLRGDQVDARTDVYALGCVLYELLAGEPPFRRASNAATLYAHLEATPPSVCEAAADVPDGLDEVVARALAKTPSDRYQATGELALAAGDVVGEELGREPEPRTAVRDADARNSDGIPTSAAFHPGTEVAGYRIEELLGRGSVGVVYSARHLMLEREVAIKFVVTDVSERFWREARLLAGVHHPNVVPIYEVGEHRDRPFIAMRLLDGSDLPEVMSPGRLEVKRAANIAVQIASALDALHAEGIVHRNVKPSDFMLTGVDLRAHTADKEGAAQVEPASSMVRKAVPSDHVYLIDLGLAERAENATAITKAGEGVVEGLDYMAPENIVGQVVGPAADVYGLACVLYEMVTGEVPYPREAMAVLYAHIHEQPPSASNHVPTVPPELDRVLSKGMAKDPDDRYESAGALTAAVMGAIA